MTSAGILSILSESTKAEEITLQSKQPNVVLIMTDDQGYGDLGYHGNNKIKTPNLDRLAKESVEFTQFYATPVCSPTRASLMTGRYNYRTGVIDTYLGRSMMYPDEVTIAEMLSSSGYRTGIFGKWHLGDNYPMRPIDQGFQEALVHKGGGIGFVADPLGNKYFDPILQHNGEPKKYKGYCTDIFTDAAIRFIEQNCDSPFFVYLSTNAPHEPLHIDEVYVKPYRAMGLAEETAKVYGMITNIDENVGRLLRKLSELNLENDTIIVFLSDNGLWYRWSPRYNAGLRGRKCDVYEGGIRVPFFMRWSDTFKRGKQIDRIASVIDVLPTLLDACGVKKLVDVPLDGVSLMPMLRGNKVEWLGRTLYTQWHRGDEPELYRNCAARSQRYKLVNGKELYDMITDPGERKNIAVRHPDIVAKMRESYENWFSDVSATREFAPPKIRLGTQFENPVILTPQDWRGRRAKWKWSRLKNGGWYWDCLGYWEVKVTQSGTYEITLRFPTLTVPAEAHFRINHLTKSQKLEKGVSTCKFDPVKLEAGEAQLKAWLKLEEKTAGVSHVYVNRLDLSYDVNVNDKLTTTWGNIRVTALLQNYPNPFNSETWIPFQLADEANVSIKIYDVAGNLVKFFNLGKRPAGSYISKDHAVYWNGKNNLGEKVSSGVYSYSLQAGVYSATKQMLILK